MTKIIAFDVNETLLDLRALDEHFEVLLSSATHKGLGCDNLCRQSLPGR